MNMPLAAATATTFLVGAVGWSWTVFFSALAACIAAAILWEEFKRRYKA